MVFPYEFDSRLVVRTPMRPLPSCSTEIDFNSLLTDNVFLEALYLASPVLYEECIKWQKGHVLNKKEIEKLMRAISKYYLRMSSRATPFGLFSGCAVAVWADNNEPLVVDSRQIRRHTRLDMHYLCALAKKLSEMPAVREGLLYLPNNSIYKISNEIRYVEYLYAEGNRKYRISSVTAFDYLVDTLRFAAGGATITQLVNALAVDSISAEDARLFIEELIDAQLLVSELEPSITGPEFMDQVIDVLQRVCRVAVPETSRVVDCLLQVRDILQSMDADCVNSIHRYKEVITLLSGLGIGFAEGKLFQTDLVKTLRQGGISSSFQQQILEALTVLNKLNSSKTDPALQSFAHRFYQRYEDKEMPLMEVLDTEIGIGYEEVSTNCMSPLVEDLQLAGANKDSRMEWSRLEILLNGKLKEVQEKNLFSLELTEKELEKFSGELNDLPPSMAVMFRAIDANTIYIESTGGSSAVNLLGRFAHADEGIRQLASDIAAREQEQDPGVIYAEIVHLPESRTGNILLHPAFRRYEIPYLAASSLDEEYQINVRDLYVSVRHGKLQLRSKRLNKQVIPRLSTAHNYAFNSLPVYRFLCDLQLQDKKKGLGFSWGSLQHQNQFLPRVMYKNTILQLAKWMFQKDDVALLRNACGEALMKAVADLRSKWKMPRYIVLSEGDNELLIDLDSISSVQLWLDAVKNKDNFVIKEFTWPGNIVSDEHQAVFSNQFIAVLQRNGASYSESKTSWAFERPEEAEQREFPLGTEWVYFKLYCGVKSADKILAEAIAPMTEALTERNVIDKWFFIRYNDPEFHLRVRFHLKDVAYIGQLITAFQQQLRQFQSGGYIWKIQADTYKREMERYGCNTITLAESLFHYDSMAFIKMLHHTAGDERENIRWIWGLRAIDELLNCFAMGTQEKLSLLIGLRDAFAAEFKVDKPVRTQLNDKYRDNKKMIDTVMKSGPELPPEWHPLIMVLKEKSQSLAPIAANIMAACQADEKTQTLREQLASYCHMLLNRIITTEARVHELVIYDFLARYYKSALMREEETTMPQAQDAGNKLFVR